MLRLIIWSTIMVGLAILMSLANFAAALAQTAIGCGTLDEVAQQLKTQFGEERIGAGLSTQILHGGKDQPTVLFQVFMSDKGTWTLIVSNPTGSACPLAAGTSWETYPIPKTGTEG